MLDTQVPPDWTVALWALDEQNPDLAEWTVGSGRGGKFDLLNLILECHPPKPGQTLIVTDDDISIRHGSLEGFLEIMRAAELGIAQPAHDRSSRSSYRINRRRFLSRARLTGFVEIGPLFAVAPGWLSAVVPFPAEVGMGWGLEVAWSELGHDGCQLGVVDAVCFDHAEAPNVTYRESLAAEYQRLHDSLAAAGVSSMSDLQSVSGTWRPWQRRAPWSAR